MGSLLLGWGGVIGLEEGSDPRIHKVRSESPLKLLAKLLHTLSFLGKDLCFRQILCVVWGH